MNRPFKKFAPFPSVIALVLFIVIGCATTNGPSQQGIKVALTGDQEVPPVKSSASRSASFVISADKSVSGRVVTSGVEATAAHIHEGAKGANGPVIVPLTKNADNSWTPAAGAKLTDAQYASYLAGNPPQIRVEKYARSYSPQNNLTVNGFIFIRERKLEYVTS